MRACTVTVQEPSRLFASVISRASEQQYNHYPTLRLKSKLEKTPSNQSSTENSTKSTTWWGRTVSTPIYTHFDLVGLEPTSHSNLFTKSLGLEPRCRHGTSLLGLSTRMRLNPLRRQAKLVPRIAREWCLHSAPPAPIWRSTPTLISVLQLGSDYPPKPSLSRSASLGSAKIMFV